LRGHVREEVSGGHWINPVGGGSDGPSGPSRS
jgi:hypothetical protein